VVCFLTRGDGVAHTCTITAVSVAGTRTSTFSYDGPFSRRSGAIRHAVSLPADLHDGASWFYSGVDSVVYTSEGTGAIAVNKACLVAAPVVSFVAEDNSAVTSGYSVTVSGMNFAVSATTPTSTIGLSSCATAAWASASSVVCMLSMGEGVSHELRVTVAGVVGSRTAIFSYDGMN